MGHKFTINCSLLIIIVGDYAFFVCYSLSEVTLIPGLTVIGKGMLYMFGYPSVLSSVVIPSSVTSIGISRIDILFTTSVENKVQ